MEQMNSSTSLQRSMQDFVEDADEVVYLVTDATQKIRAFTIKLQGIRKHIYSDNLKILEAESTQMLNLYEDIRLNIYTHTEALNNKVSESLLNAAYDCIEKSRETLRIHQAKLGALLTSTNWQSPSFAHSVRSQAGVDEGLIEANINDYKRDQHFNAQQYEQSFKKKYIDGLITFPVNIYATSSGMAAFSTIISYLFFEKKLKGTILIGESLYFECKALLVQLPHISIIEVDETDTKKIIKLIDLHQPSVVFFDSLANMPSVAVPNLEVIISHLISHGKKQSILVVDNTCRSVYFQPVPIIFGRFSKLSLIVFESLNKYHQFGMDRVTGGIIWCYGGDTGKISNYRVHTGTNISDLSAAALPTPNRRLLNRKLQRHGRNATYMARVLNRWIMNHPKSHVTSIVYPQLQNHLSYDWTKMHAFSGAFLTLQFEKKYQTVASYKRFIRIVLKLTAEAHIPIVSGTSFGLHTTRIYLTAIRSTPTTPFVRISAGTEHFSAIESITKIITQSLERFG